MKSILILISLVFTFQEISFHGFFSENSIETPIKAIENGWYDASVAYYNPSTYQRSNYTLSVKVEYDRVTVIDFGNGGSVHSGYNNSGYTYSGGSLSMKRDYQGNIVAATTRISVSDSNGIRTYDITIE
jgi:hypothetical protein